MLCHPLLEHLKIKINFFVDSRTTAETIGETTMKVFDVPTASRNIFLDNDDDEEKITQQLMKLVRKSEQNGFAIGIGHVKPKTLNVLKNNIPKLKKDGYKFEFVSKNVALKFMAISCRVTRGDLTESIHVAFGTAVDKNGQVFFSSGDPHYLTCIRSSLKPFQTAASIKSGAIDSANFSDKEIALMCASHQGEEDHINTAKSMLEKLNLSVENYECGSHLPSNKKVRYDMIQQEISPTSLHNNCSGKHAGMLALGTYLGKGINGYTKKKSPGAKNNYQLC